MREHAMTWSSITIAAVLVLSCAGSAAARDEVSVKGEIVDLACYMAKGSRGPTHKACAKMCAQKGVPIGVLTAEGEVFLLLRDDDNAKSYEAVQALAGEYAEVTGTKLSKGGIAGITVGAVKVAASPEPDRVAGLPGTEPR